MRTTVAAENLYAMLDGSGLFDRSSMHLLLVKDGHEALSLCRSRAVDLAIFQQTMGGVSGVSVCRALKKIPASPRIILVLDNTDAPLRRSAEAAGADGVLVRPLEPRALVTLAAHVLGIAAREEVRVLTRLRCAATLPGREMVIGTAVDISSSGLRVEADTALKQDETVTAEFFLPGSSAPCVVTCQVMRVDRSETTYVYGLRFLNSNADLTQRVREFVSTRQRPA